MRTLIALLLGAHGLIHVSYFAPRPADATAWPFILDRSWLLASLNAPVLRGIGLALSAIAAVAFIAAALGLLGVTVLSGVWQPLAIVGAAASLLLLVAFWHYWLVLGIVLSAGVLYAIFWAHWPTALFGTA